MRHRLAAAVPLALLLLAIVAAPASAGGVAIVIPAETGGRAITAGEATTLTFQLLQHGVTPVDFGVTTVVFTDTASGETFGATTRPTDRAGWYEASFTYPKGGYWAWHVDHDGLAIESAPVVVGVFEQDGTMPAYWPGHARTRQASRWRRSWTTCAPSATASRRSSTRFARPRRPRQARSPPPKDARRCPRS